MLFEKLRYESHDTLLGHPHLVSKLQSVLSNSHRPYERDVDHVVKAHSHYTSRPNIAPPTFLSAEQVPCLFLTVHPLFSEFSWAAYDLEPCLLLNNIDFR